MLSTTDQNLNEQHLLAFANIIDLRDPYVCGHSEQVARYVTLINKELGLEIAKLYKFIKPLFYTI
jgi:HD-GYP domain-containing protein (c-di-GMP phosphodiesterase class II)